MKRILLFISLSFLLLVPTQGQIGRFPFYITTSTSATPEGNCDEYETVLTAMTTDPDATNQGYQNTLVVDLKAAGVWSKGDVIYVTAVHTNSGGEARINWKNPGTFNLSDPGSTNPTFTAYEGFASDGTSDYLSTNYNVAADGINASLNSTTMAVYNRATVPDSPTGSHYFIGANEWPNYSHLSLDVNGAGSFDLISQCNSGDPYNIAFNIGSGAIGFFVATRRGDTDNELYKNGTSIATDAESYSGGETNRDFILFALDQNGTPEGFLSCQISFVYIGGGLTDTEVANMNTAVEKYMDAIGKGVQ